MLAVSTRTKFPDPATTGVIYHTSATEFTPPFVVTLTEAVAFARPVAVEDADKLSDEVLETNAEVLVTVPVVVTVPLTELDAVEFETGVVDNPHCVATGVSAEP